MQLLRKIKEFLNNGRIKERIREKKRGNEVRKEGRLSYYAVNKLEMNQTGNKRPLKRLLLSSIQKK